MNKLKILIKEKDNEINSLNDELEKYNNIINENKLKFNKRIREKDDEISKLKYANQE